MSRDFILHDPRANRRHRGRLGGAGRRGHRWAGSGPSSAESADGGRSGAIVALVLGPSAVHGGLSWLLPTVVSAPATGSAGGSWLDRGADRHGPRWAGAGPLPPHGMTPSRVRNRCQSRRDLRALPPASARSRVPHARVDGRCQGRRGGGVPTLAWRRPRKRVGPETFLMTTTTRICSTCRLRARTARGVRRPLAAGAGPRTRRRSRPTAGRNWPRICPLRCS